MKVTVGITGIDEATRALTEGFSERRLRGAMATALTRTAFDIKRTWEGNLATRLDRPTKSTLGAVAAAGATAARLTAVVYVKDQASGTPPVEWLAPEERGGQRGAKEFEKSLMKQGAIPPGSYLVPGPAAKLDGFGNVSRGQIVQVLAQLGAQYSPGYQRVISKSATKRAQKALLTGRAYVAIPRGRGALKAGIYERKGRGLVAVFYIVSRATYRPRTGLVATAQQDAPGLLEGHVRRAIEENAKALAAKAGR